MVKTTLDKLDAADLSRRGRTRRTFSPGWATSALLMIRLPVWLSGQTFLVHRKPLTCAILADAIRQKLNWNASIPVQSATVET
jgi:hypothetical protein